MDEGIALNGLVSGAAFFISGGSQSCLCSAQIGKLRILSVRNEDSLQGGYRKNYLC